MQTLIILILVFILVSALWFTIRKFRKGGGSCGEHETVKANRVKDRNPSHYPYSVSLTLGGMTCENCARRIENELNGLEGVWARVSFSTKKADVRCKSVPDETTLRRSVSDAGYVVMEFRTCHQN